MKFGLDYRRLRPEQGQARVVVVSSLIELRRLHDDDFQEGSHMALHQVATEDASVLFRNGEVTYNPGPPFVIGNVA